MNFVDGARMIYLCEERFTEHMNYVCNALIIIRQQLACSFLNLLKYPQPIMLSRFKTELGDKK